MKNNSTIDVLPLRSEGFPICCCECEHYIDEWEDTSCSLDYETQKKEEGISTTKCCYRCQAYNECCGKTIEALKFYEQYKGKVNNNENK